MLILVSKATAPKFPPLGVTDRKIRTAILRAVAHIRDETVRRDVIEALDRGDVQAAVDAIRFDEGERLLRSVIPADLRGAYELAGARAATTLSRSLRAVARFDLTNPASVEYARTRSADMIREFGRSSRDAVRGLIERAFEEGIPPRRLAPMLIDSGIGLTDRYAKAVDRYRRELQLSDREQGQVDRMTQRYADRLLKIRAENIARTETLAAENEGQRELWNQAAADGLLDPTTTRRRWIVTEDDRLCPLCEPLDGETVPLLGGVYSGGVSGPPLHPQCRCAEVIET